jgi:hypothetical protein
MTYYRCTRCGKEKPLTDYYAPAPVLGKQCKLCDKISCHESRIRNIEHIREYNRKYVQENPRQREARKKRSAEWARENPEAARESARKWIQNNKDKVKANQARWRERHREELRIKSRERRAAIKQRTLDAQGMLAERNDAERQAE